VDKPTIGRIVHYKERGGTIFPAIITAVWSETCVNLGVFTSVYVEKTSVLLGDAEMEWNWPVRN
jgi:hypothetical protein